MIGGGGETVGAPRPGVQDAGAGPRRRAAHAGPRRHDRYCRGRPPALRAGRRGALREDGAQRHRIRADGRLRRRLQHPRARRGRCAPAAGDAEPRPSAQPEHYQYDFALPEVAELWRRGSVVGSWLLDLTARALAEQPNLKPFSGHVSDSGEGRWTVGAAIETARRRRSRRRALSPLQLPQGRRLREPSAVGDALSVRWPRRTSGVRSVGDHFWQNRVCDAHADALVLFGATGDLAYQQIFPALQSMFATAA